MSLDNIIKSNKPQGLELKIAKILAEIGAAIPQGKTVDVGGKTYTVDELVKKLQSYQALFIGPRETRASLRQMVADREAATPEVVGFLSDLGAGFVGVLGRKNPELDKLGYPPRKENRKLTAEELLHRSEKARLTRELRHTLGPRQKEQLKASDQPPPATNGAHA